MQAGRRQTAKLIQGFDLARPLTGRTVGQECGESGGWLREYKADGSRYGR